MVFLPSFWRRIWGSRQCSTSQYPNLYGNALNLDYETAKHTGNNAANKWQQKRKRPFRMTWTVWVSFYNKVKYYKLTEKAPEMLFSWWAHETAAWGTPQYHSSLCTEWIMKHICAFVLPSIVCSAFHSLSDLVIQSDLLQDAGGGRRGGGGDALYAIPSLHQENCWEHVIWNLTSI